MSKDIEVVHPSHYNQPGEMEAWDEMEIVFGEEAVFWFCVLSAWKYRKRAPYKGQQEKDMSKANEFMKKAKEIKERWINAKTKQR